MIELNFEKMYSQMAGKNYPTDCIALNAGLYAISAGGKRFRFLLSLDTAKAFKNATNKNAHRLAVAVELIHNYSLIHDDLPCMDNADERRGLPSCQKKFGDTQAVLAGDGLLTSAIEIIVGGKAEQNYFDASKYIFKCAGFGGMIYGQSIDVLNENLTFDEYKKLSKLKTSQLICASVVSQAILAGATNDTKKLLTEFCVKLGLIYQFVDDLFDKDEDTQKTSILTFFSYEKAKEVIFIIAKEANILLNKLNDNFSKNTFNFLKTRLDEVLKRIFD